MVTVEGRGRLTRMHHLYLPVQTLWDEAQSWLQRDRASGVWHTAGPVVTTLTLTPARAEGAAQRRALPLAPVHRAGGELWASIRSSFSSPAQHLATPEP